MSADRGSDEKVVLPSVLPDTHGDSEPCGEIVMSKKQRKRLLKAQRIKETKSQWRY